MNTNGCNYKLTSPGQTLNSAGGPATITINGGGALSTGTVNIATVAPGLFAANADGKDAAAAVALCVKADGSQIFEPVTRFDAASHSFVPAPIDLGPDLGDATDQIFLLLFGTGLRFRDSLSNVNVSLGGANAQVLYAGSQGFFAGLDQINVKVERALAGRGEITVSLSVDGKTANPVTIAIK